MSPATELASGRAGEPVSLEWEIEVPWEGSLDLDLDRPWKLSVKSDGFWAALVELEPGEQADNSRLRLIPTGRLSGRMRVAEKEPLPAEIMLRLEATPEAPKRGGTEGKNEAEPIPRSHLECFVKAATWSCEVPKGRLDLRLQAGDFVPFYLWGAEIQAGMTLDVGTLLLERGASLVGWVETAEPEAEAPPAEVALRPQINGWQGDPLTRKRIDSRASHTEVTDRGFFQLKALPPGGYALTVSKPGFSPGEIPSITLEAQQELVLEQPIVLYPPETLEVYLEPPVDFKGQPWLVALMRSEAFSNVSTVVKKTSASLQGHWQHTLAQGPYYLEIRDSTGSTVLAESVQVEPGMPPLFLSLGSVAVRGTISLGDEPVTTEIVFGTTSGRPNVFLESDERGRFEGYLPREGTWPVEIAKPEGKGHQAVEPVEVRKSPGKSYAEVEIALPDTRLSGIVVENGEPVPGALVGILNHEADPVKIYQGGRKRANVDVDEEGRFELRGLSPGPLLVSGYLGDRESAWVPVDLQEGSDGPELRLELKRRFEVSGRVASPAGVVPGAEVTLLSANRVTQPWEEKAVTAVDGSFRLKLPDEVRVADLLISPPGLPFEIRRVALDPNQDSPLTIAVEPRGGSLVLRRLDVLESFLVHNGAVISVSELLTVMGTTDRVGQHPEGGITLLNMGPGEYSYCSGSDPQGDGCESTWLMPHGESVFGPSTASGESPLDSEVEVHE